MRGNFATALGALSALFLGAAPAAFAQEVVLEEVVVTAQKREQTLQDVPSSVSAVSTDSINDYLGAAENLRALTGRVPSLNIESSNGRTQPRIYIRGLGNIDFDNNASQPVAMVYDEIALESNVLRSLPLFDIERVEVLKGPQGSLFGRNTNAGIVKIDSVKPTDELDGYIRLGYGVRETLFTEAAVGNQFAEGINARLAVKYQERGNWIDNITNGPGDDYGQFDEFAYRLQFAFEPNDDFTALIKLHGFEQSGSQPQVFYAGAIAQGSPGLRPGFNEEVVTQDNGAGMDLSHSGGAVNLRWDFSDNNGDYSLTSITGYDSIENFQFTDVDGGVQNFAVGELGAAPFAQLATGDGLDDHHQLTQEFRFAAENDRRFYQVGLYIFDEDYTIRNGVFDATNAPIDTTFVSQATESIAAFGQVEFALNDQWALTVGGRYTWDDKELEVTPGPGSTAPPDTIAVDDDYFNWDVAVTFDQNEDWRWYGRLANGSRGPVTLGRFGFVSKADTETSTSLEFGFKSTLLDGRARWNTSVYAFRNDDQQLTATGGVANINQLLNADKVNGQGLETELDVLFSENLLVSANLSYNDTEIDDPGLGAELCGGAPSCTGLDPVIGMRSGAFGPVTDVSIDGNPLPRTPEYLFNLIVQYTVPLENGSLYFNTDWNYRDEASLFLYQSVEYVAEDRWLGGVRIGYRNAAENIDVALVGRNITDELTVDGSIDFLNLSAFINEPAFWGVEFKYSFGE